MPEKFSIYVQEKHIINGQARCGFLCPIALAVQEYFEGVDIGVYTGTINSEYYYHNGSDFVKSFDRFERVSPRIIIFEKDDKLI